jgi:hypothetical protein
MKLIVISELKFCEDLIYRIDTVELGVVVKLVSGFCLTFTNNFSGSIPPNFGQRFAGIFL